jgi:hypothetical protein
MFDTFLGVGRNCVLDIPLPQVPDLAAVILAAGGCAPYVRLAALINFN